MGYVDRVAVKVWPDTRTFDREMRRTTAKRRETVIRAVLDAVDARAELKKLEKTRTVADLDVRTEKAKAKLAALKKDLALDQQKSIDITADIREARTRITQLRADLAGVSDNNAKVEIRAEIKEATARIAQLRADLAKVRDHKFEVQAETTKARKELNDLEKDRKVVFQAQVDSLNARRELIMLARKRIAEIWVRVNSSKAMADVKAIMAGLAGINLVSNWKRQFVEMFEELPQTILRIGMIGSALAALIVPAMSALSALAPIGATLRDIGPAALGAIPILAGLTSMVSVLVLAFRGLRRSSAPAVKAFVAELDKVRPKLTDIKQAVQEAFFSSGFTSAFAHMTTKLLPDLKSGLSEVAVSTGDVGAAMMRAFTGALDDGKLATFFANLSSGLERGKSGFADLVAGMTNITTVGSEVFPEMGAWISDIGARFREWTENSDLEAMLRGGAEQMGYLWEATKNLGSVIAGVFRAMDTGKSTGLESFADTLGRVRDIVWSPGFQDAMRTVFTGAAAGASALREALGPIGDALEQLSPLLGSILGTFGKIAASALVGIANALAQPVAQNGLQAALTGISLIMANMPWDALGAGLGAIGSAIGVIAPLVSDLLTALAPLLPLIVSAIATLIPPLTEIVRVVLPSLVQIITALLPIIVALAPIIAALAPPIAVLIEGLAAGLVPALGLLASAIQAVTPLFQWWMGVMTEVFEAAMAYFAGDWDGAMRILVEVTNRGLNDVLAFVKSMVGQAVAAIGKWASDMAAQMRQMWADAVAKASAGVADVVKWISDLPSKAVRALGNVGSILSGAGSAVIQGFWDGAKAVWEKVKTWVGGLADWIAKHKGPLPYDYQLLQPAGRKIMAGLHDSMRDGMREVEGLVSAFAPRVAASFDGAAGASVGNSTSLSIGSLAVGTLPPHIQDAVERIVEYVSGPQAAVAAGR